MFATTAFLAQDVMDQYMTEEGLGRPIPISLGSKKRGLTLVRVTSPRELEELAGIVPDFTGERIRDDRALYRRKVRQIIKKLSTDERRYVYLRFFQDLSEGDIALKMRMSIGEVRRLKRSAFAALLALIPNPD